jgi:methylmalonyl-CoA/ethylmalonyl-CoA epimerase
MNSGYLAPEQKVHLKFDHIGVVVKSLAIGRVSLNSAIGMNEWTREFRDEINGVEIQFGRDPAGIVHELLVPLDEKSPVYAALSGKRNILNHIAYIVPELSMANDQMRQNGCLPLGPEKAAIAYGNKNIQFFLTPINTIIELIEAPNHNHRFYIGDEWRDIGN